MVRIHNSSSCKEIDFKLKYLIYIIFYFFPFQKRGKKKVQIKIRNKFEKPSLFQEKTKLSTTIMIIFSIHWILNSLNMISTSWILYFNNIKLHKKIISNGIITTIKGKKEKKRSIAFWCGPRFHRILYNIFFQIMKVKKISLKNYFRVLFPIIHKDPMLILFFHQIT